jgi:serine/threonine protein kinase
VRLDVSHAVHRNDCRRRQISQVIDDMGSDKLILFLQYMVHGPVQSPETPVTLPEARCHEVVTDVLHALRYLHRRGVVHNDIKPENIVVGHNLSAKLTDFGASQVCCFLSLSTQQCWSLKLCLSERRCLHERSVQDCCAGVVPYSSGAPWSVELGCAHCDAAADDLAPVGGG